MSFLQQQGLASNADVAADLCQRMLSQNLFKSIYHREVFLPDGEVYRFSSSFPDGNKQKGRCVVLCVKQKSTQPGRLLPLTPSTPAMVCNGVEDQDQQQQEQWGLSDRFKQACHKPVPGSL